MEVRTKRNEPELAELTKLINRKVSNIRKLDLAKIEKIVKNGTNTEITKRRLVSTETNFPLKTVNCNVRNNFILHEWWQLMCKKRNIINKSQ